MIPQRQPKDSPAYQRWYAALLDGNRTADAPTFEPRVCIVDGVSFTPRVGNQRRCPECIAHDRRRSA